MKYQEMKKRQSNKQIQIQDQISRDCWIRNYEINRLLLYLQSNYPQYINYEFIQNNKYSIYLKADNSHRQKQAVIFQILSNTFTTKFKKQDADLSTNYGIHTVSEFNYDNLIIKEFDHEPYSQIIRKFKPNDIDQQNQKYIHHLEVDISRKMVEIKEISTIGGLIQSCFNLTHLLLNLSLCNLNSQMVIQLGDDISKCRNIIFIQIDLQNNSINSQGAIGLFKGISRCAYLDYLNVKLSENVIGVEGVIGIADQIIVCINLNTLILDLEYNNVGSHGIHILAQSIKKCLKLENLNLNLQKSKIGQQGFKQLCEGLKDSTNIISLNLDIRDCDLTNNYELQLIGKTFSSLHNLQILTIDLVKNIIDKQELSQMCKEISKCKSLVILFVQASLYKLKMNIKEKKLIDNSIKKAIRLVNYVIT